MILLGSTASLLCLARRLTCQQTAFYARSVVYILRVILTVNSKKGIKLRSPMLTDFRNDAVCLNVPISPI